MTFISAEPGTAFVHVSGTACTQSDKVNLDLLTNVGDLWEEAVIAWYFDDDYVMIKPRAMTAEGAVEPKGKMWAIRDDKGRVLDSGIGPCRSVREWLESLRMKLEVDLKLEKEKMGAGR